MKTLDKKARQKNLKNLIKLVEDSGAFDEAFYRAQLKGSAKKHNNLISHYLNEGWIAGLNPHPCFNTDYYLKHNQDVAELNLHPFLHFVVYGWSEDRYTSESFSLTDYRKRHPEIVENLINPLKHFSFHANAKEVARKITTKINSKESLSELDVDERHLMNQAIQAGLFDADWYRATYNSNIGDDLSAFRDYQRKSIFSNINPSQSFDTETYHRLYSDVYHAQISPLTHYLLCGREEGRISPAAVNRWQPAGVITGNPIVSEAVKKLKIAICLHIFYEDYIKRFSSALDNFPIEVDVFVSVIDKGLTHKISEEFSNNPKIRKLIVRCVPNRGRNFGPLLTEFSKELLSYDLFCHLHSKKSLYSGREQHQWASYLAEYLLNDKVLISKVLNAFHADIDLGLFYPTTFWMMPSWVNHLTMNKHFVKDWCGKLGIPATAHDFLCYPAGGMFWARPKAMAQLLSLDFKYEDFPAEPLPNDGSSLHGLERVLGPMVEANGYKQFFYHPNTATLTSDQSYIMQCYHVSLDTLQQQTRQYSHISFDVFDTLVRREHTVPDYAKILLGEELSVRGMVKDATTFVSLRNLVEFELRKKSNFQGDIRIDEIYAEIATLLNLNSNAADELMRREFELDLDMLIAKNEMVDIFNSLGSSGHVLWVISDTYYTGSQVSLILKKAGITAPYRLVVSSEERKRKDNGTMWAMIKQDLLAEGSPLHVHIGDNVVADSQIPGDLGINTMHILHPLDKWRALGFPTVLSGNETPSVYEIKKWGSLISSVGRYPFIGE